MQPVNKGEERTPELDIDDIHGYVTGRLEAVSTIGELVKFHSINKYLIMAHSPYRLNRLGNIVANHKKSPVSDILEEYRAEMAEVFLSGPSVKSHYNTLLHILGHFSSDLLAAEKKQFLDMFDGYKNGKIMIKDVLAALKDCTAKYEKSYLARQTYFLFFTSPERP